MGLLESTEALVDSKCKKLDCQCKGFAPSKTGFRDVDGVVVLSECKRGLL